MEERLDKMQKQINGMQEIIIALYLVQDRITQFRLEKAYPQLKELIK